MDHDPVFGRWLQRRRKALSMTQNELGHCAGCSTATVRKIEADERRPSKSLAENLAKCLEISPDERTDFLRFARGGWADEAPAPPLALPDLPRSGEGLARPAFLKLADPEPGPRSSTVTRIHELGWLEGHLSSALEGQGQVAFVAGEAGSGKTTLLDEFASRSMAAHPDLVVARGLCDAFAGAGDPYLPFRDVVTMLLGDVEARWAAGALSGDHARRLWRAAADTLPELATRGLDLVGILASHRSLAQAALAATDAGRTVAAPSPAARGAQLPQPQLFDQAVDVICALAGRHPLVLMLDDLQWADGGSIGLLFHLSRRLATHRVLVVGAYRSDEVALGLSIEGVGRHPLVPLVNEVRRSYGDVVLSLDRSGPIGGRAFVDALLDSEPNRLSELFKDELHRRTEGHPLFTVELLHDLQARGDLVKDSHGRWHESSSLAWEALPARVEAVIEQRFGRLLPELRDLLAVASVEGEVFTAEVLAQVQGMTQLEVLRALEGDLVGRHGLVREEGEVIADGRPLARYRFGHALFQQYLYQGLGRGQRRLLHREAARAMEMLHGEEVDQVLPEIAHHYLEAGDTLQAAHYHMRAGARARRFVAFEEAVRLYRVALDLLPEEDGTDRARCLQELGECLWLVGALDEALDVFHAGYTAYQALGDTTAAGAMQRHIGRIHWERSDRERSLVHYHQALEILEAGPESVELAWAVSSISQMHMLASEYSDAIREGERALALAERLGVEAVRAHALNNVGAAWMSVGEPERGQAILQESFELAQALHLPHDAGRAIGNLTENLISWGRYREARELLENEVGLAEPDRPVLFVKASHLQLVELDWRCGRWTDALQRLAEVGSTSSEPEMGHLTVRGVTVTAMIENALDRSEVALAILEAHRDLAERSGEMQTLLPYVGEQIIAYVALGREVEANAELEGMLALLEGSSQMDPHDTAVYIGFACGYLASRGELGRARAFKHQLERLVDQQPAPGPTAGLSEAEAALALAEDDVGATSQHAREAAEGWAALGHPLDRARALSTLGRSSLLQGDSVQACRVLSEARELLDGLADQLAEDTKTSFQNSPLVRRVYEALA